MLASGIRSSLLNLPNLVISQVRGLHPDNILPSSRIAIYSVHTLRRKESTADQSRYDMAPDAQTAPEGESATTPVEVVDFASIVYSWTPEERAAREKAFVRKIDFRMIPILVSIVASSCFFLRKTD